MRTSNLERAALHGDELIQTPIGDIELRHSYFDDDASRWLFDEMDFQRACRSRSHEDVEARLLHAHLI